MAFCQSQAADGRSRTSSTSSRRPPERHAVRDPYPGACGRLSALFFSRSARASRPSRRRPPRSGRGSPRASSRRSAAARCPWRGRCWRCRRCCCRPRRRRAPHPRRSPGRGRTPAGSPPPPGAGRRWPSGGTRSSRRCRCTLAAARPSSDRS